MRCGIFLYAAMLMVTGASLGAAPKFATTIDFLDYVFYDVKDGNKEFYPLEVYEQRLRELAEGGIKKIYLRVNVCGLTLYPTRVSAIYGENGAFHWGTPAESKRLIGTLARYDVCTETIRIGKKYGMEVWAWDSLWDDSAYMLDWDSCAPEYREFYKRHAGMPMIDPWYVKHPEAFAMLDPRLAPPSDEIERLTREAREFPVGSIEIINQPGSDSDRPLRFAPDSLEIHTSQDSFNWTPYSGTFKFSSGKKDGRNFIRFDNLRIDAPYIRVVHTQDFGKNTDFALVIRDARNQCSVWNTRGKKIAAVWAGNFRKKEGGEAGSFNFSRFEAFAFDYEAYQVGFVVGEVDADRRFVGVPEYLVPAARDHKLERFSELARYPFDGFMWNVRSHSFGFNPDHYGFNPEVREAFLKRYGVDIWKDEFDRSKLYALRAEGIADFFKLCKERSGGRPVWLSGLPPEPGSYSPDEVPPMTRAFTKLPWLYKRYFSDGSIDGVVMLGKDFSDYFTGEVTGGKPVSLGVFREMGFPPDGYDYVKDMQELKRNDRLDEVELYESMVFSFDPKMFGELK